MALLSQLTVRMKAETGSFHTDMKRAAKVSKQSGGDMTKAFKDASKAIVAGAAAATAATSKMVGDYVRDADKYSKMTDKLGGSVETWSKMEFVAERSGASFEQLSIAMQRMSRRIGEAAATGKGEAVPMLKALGLEAKELAKLPIDEQFRAVGKEISAVSGQSNKLTAAFKFFDSEGVGPVLQALSGGIEGFDAMTAEAERFGFVMDTETAESAVRFKDSLTNMKTAATGLSRTYAAEFIPLLVNMAEAFVGTGDAQEYARKAGESGAKILRNVAAVVVLLGRGVQALGGLFWKLGETMLRFLFDIAEPSIGAYRSLGAAIQHLATGNIPAANAEFILMGKHVSSIRAGGKSLMNDMKTAWSNAVDTVSKGLEEYNKIMALSIDFVKDASVSTSDYRVDLSEAFRRMQEAAEGQKVLNEMIKQGEGLFRRITGVIDPAKLAAMELAEATAALAAYLESVGITGEEAARYLEALRDEMGKTGDEMKSLAVIMEEQVKALDGAFRNMWQTFLDEGKLSMDGIKDLFKNLMAELLHRAITQPIVLRLQGAMSDAFGGGSGGGLFGGSSGGLMGTISNAFLGAGIGGAIGGDAGAIGGAIGSLGAINGLLGNVLVGSLSGAGFSGLAAFASNFIAPVIGPLIGALVGKFVGKLLERDPEIWFKGSNLKPIEEESALGGFWIRARGGTGPQADPSTFAGQAVAAIREFDDAIASFLSENQISKIVEAMKNWDLHLKNSTVSIENVLESRWGVILSTFSQTAQQYVRSFDGLEEQTQALARWVTAWNTMSEVIHKFVSSTVGEIATSATSGMSSTGALTFYGTALRELLESFNDTPEMMNEISNAIDMRYRAELEYIQGIDNLVSQIGQSIEQQRMKLQGLIAADEQDPYKLFAKASAAMRGIRRADSPEEIARLVAQAQQFIQMAADAFPEEGLTRMIASGRKGEFTEMFTSREDFIGGLLRMLDTIEGSATVRANTLRENALAESVALREETRMFAEQQGIDLEAIETAANGTTQAVQDQTVVIQDGNAQIIGAVNELGALIAKQGFNDSGFRAS